MSTLERAAQAFCGKPKIGERTTTIWSRATTGESVPESRGRFSSKSSAGTDVQVTRATRAQVRESCRAAVRKAALVVTLSESSPAHGGPPGAALRLLAASRGFEALCEWPEASLLGGSGRMLEAWEPDLCCMDPAKLQAAQQTGAPFSYTRTLQKASGELCRVHQHTRGLSLGTDLGSGEEVWYLLSVYVDVTDEGSDDLDRVQDVECHRWDAAAHAVANCLRADISSEIEACVHFASCASEDDNECAEDEGGLVSISAPVWRHADVGAELRAAGLEA